MAPAEVEQTTYIIEDFDKIAQFRVSGSVILFPGFLVLYKDEESEEENLLPQIKEKSPLKLIEVNSENTQQSLLQDTQRQHLSGRLEEKGIGRPSTYAAILSTIQERDYVKKIKQRLYPTYLVLLSMTFLRINFLNLWTIVLLQKWKKTLIRFH